MARRNHIIYSAKDLLDLQDDPDRWIVPNMIPRAGRTLVYGQGGAFKSTIVFDLAIAMTSQHFLFQQFAVNKHGPVLVNSTEGNIYESKRRILAHARAHEANPAEIPFYFCQQPFYLDDNKDVYELRKKVEEFKPIMIVLDPLDSFFSGDENSAKETKLVRRTIDELIDDYDIAFIILHHETKSSDKPTPRGSGAWYGWADSVLHVKGMKKVIPGVGEPLDFVEITGQKQRNGKTGKVFSGVPNIDEVLDVVTFTFYEGADASDVVLNYMKKAVYKTLRASPEPMTNQMVADALKIRAEKLVDAFLSLERAELIAKDAYVERPFGPRSSRVRKVPAWRALVRSTVVDNAIIMAQSLRRSEEDLAREYDIVPLVPNSVPIIEAGDPEPIFDVIGSEYDADRPDADTVGFVGSAPGAGVQSVLH